MLAIRGEDTCASVVVVVVVEIETLGIYMCVAVDGMGRTGWWCQHVGMGRGGVQGVPFHRNHRLHKVWTDDEDQSFESLLCAGIIEAVSTAVR